MRKFYIKPDLSQVCMWVWLFITMHFSAFPLSFSAFIFFYFILTFLLPSLSSLLFSSFILFVSQFKFVYTVYIDPFFLFEQFFFFFISHFNQYQKNRSYSHGLPFCGCCFYTSQSELQSHKEIVMLKDHHTTLPQDRTSFHYLQKYENIVSFPKCNGSYKICFYSLAN